MFDAFPDMHVDVKQTMAQGDLAAIEFTFAGTHEGPMAMPSGPTVPATGKKVIAKGCNTFEFANGKIVRNSLYWDQLGMMARMGLMPGM